MPGTACVSKGVMCIIPSLSSSLSLIRLMYTMGTVARRPCYMGYQSTQQRDFTSKVADACTESSCVYIKRYMKFVPSDGGISEILC